MTLPLERLMRADRRSRTRSLASLVTPTGLTAFRPVGSATCQAASPNRNLPDEALAWPWRTLAAAPTIIRNSGASSPAMRRKASIDANWHVERQRGAVDVGRGTIAHEFTCCWAERSRNRASLGTVARRRALQITLDRGDT